MQSIRPLSSRIVRYVGSALGVAVIAGAGFIAYAQATESTGSVATQASTATAAVRSVFQGPSLNMGEIYQRVENQGYSEVREIEWDDGLYKVKARNAEGHPIKLYVDGHNGKILSQRLRD
ncbi:PepSY domain-containing protein [Comamonas composti]|uniref:PepSY domain-containing protein n=1 Tax=Comamonas composti TaxID=408558 RepID=UPI0003F5AE0C|nr:PepSY domain-containing protein [Comamonas composti]